MTDDYHQFDRRKHDPNVAALALRVTALEQRMEQFDEGLRKNTVELKANTALTELIHGNTEDIVAAMKGLKGFWEFSSRWGKRVAVAAKYGTYIVGFVAAILAAFSFRK